MHDPPENAYRYRPMKHVSVMLLLWLGLGCGEEPIADKTPVHLKLLYPVGGLGDRSFADGVYEGVIRASLEVDLHKTQVVPHDEADAAEVLESWLADPSVDPELIVTVGSAFAPSVVALGCELDGRYLLHLDTPLPACPRRQSIAYRSFAPSFLAGVAAMEVSALRRAAVVGGMDLPAVNEFIRGFCAGVEFAGGVITAVEYLADGEQGFSDSQGASELADALFTEADVIFPVAGGSGVGVIERAKTLSDRYVIGVDSDQSWLGRGVVLASVTKRLDRSVQEVILRLADGHFDAGHRALGLTEGGMDLALNERFDDILHAAVAAAREAAERAAILDREAHP